MNTTMNVTMTLEFKLDLLVDVWETFDQFDVELHLLKKKHAIKGCEGVKSFLQFLKSFGSYQIHYTLPLVLNPRLILMDCSNLCGAWKCNSFCNQTWCERSHPPPNDRFWTIKPYCPIPNNCFNW